MVLLQNKLNLKVSQKQVLTPGLVQMVTVLALNKLELKEMIDEEMVENPVLEELEEGVPTVDEIASREEHRDREEVPDPVTGEKTDPFEEIDFGSFFQDYLDPGPRTSYGDMEEYDRPSFENFLSSPTTLTDHLLWQLGSVNVEPAVRAAAELIIGNLDEDGYLSASDEELLGLPDEKKHRHAAEPAENSIADSAPECVALEEDAQLSAGEFSSAHAEAATTAPAPCLQIVSRSEHPVEETTTGRPHMVGQLTRETLEEARRVVHSFDPIGVAARDLRECLLLQLRHHQQINLRNHLEDDQVIADAIAVVESHLNAVQLKNFKEIARAIGRPVEAVMAALDYVKTLDPKPGMRYNAPNARLIEPDVAFVKQGEEWLVLMNDEGVPQLRVSPTYKRLLHKDAAEKDVRNYVKERYKSAIQLIKNIEQRKQTILKVCYSIVERQGEFLELGVTRLKPMMIKEVAEEIGVHPSTVSRAVANKYVHTPQGVFELRYFFSEGVQGPEGGGTSLVTLKHRVKKLIEEEDSARPLTDEQLTRILQSQGIQVTRRTVAKYREDMKIPSTHQRRVKN